MNSRLWFTLTQLVLVQLDCQTKPGKCLSTCIMITWPASVHSVAQGPQRPQRRRSEDQTHLDNVMMAAADVHLHKHSSGGEFVWNITCHISCLLPSLSPPLRCAYLPGVASSMHRLTWGCTRGTVSSRCTRSSYGNEGVTMTTVNWLPWGCRREMLLRALMVWHWGQSSSLLVMALQG